MTDPSELVETSRNTVGTAEILFLWNLIIKITKTKIILLPTYGWSILTTLPPWSDSEDQRT